MALYDFRPIGSFALPTIAAAGDVPPLKIAEANGLRRGLYLVSFTNDFFLVADASPQTAAKAFRVPGNIGRIFKIGEEPITDTGPIYLYGALAATTVFAGELVEISGAQV